MSTLALDPAARTGFCIDFDATPGVPPNLLFGVWQLGSGPGRLDLLERKLQGMFERFPGLDTIVYENAASGGARNFQAVSAHLELQTVIKRFADQHGLKHWSYYVPQWKAIALGQGNAKPERYRELVELHYGHAVSTADEAAAIAIWYAAQKGPPPKSAKKRAKATKKALAKKQGRLFR